jgi:hypothetical protein
LAAGISNILKASGLELCPVGHILNVDQVTFRGVKKLAYEAARLLLSGAEDKNAWSLTSIIPFDFIA